MEERKSKAYQSGIRAAQEAIANEVPRWVTTRDQTYGQNIHPATGLPLMSLSGPSELHEDNEAFAKGNNDEVTAAIKSGAIKVDFRPLLMSREECLSAMANSSVGVLSEETGKLESEDGSIVILLRKATKRKPGPVQWITYSHDEWGTWPRFALYEGPIEIALAKEERVLLIRSPQVLNTYDVETTQILNTYLV